MDVVKSECVGFSSQRLPRSNAAMRRCVDERKATGILTFVAHHAHMARSLRTAASMVVVLSLIMVGGPSGNEPVPAVAASPPWPTFHHDNARTGLSPFNTAANNGTLLWEYKPGNGGYGSSVVVSSPAIGADGTVYFGADDDNIYALNSNGALKWFYGTAGAVRASPAIGPDGTIYIASEDKYLYALNPDGTLKWKYPINGATWGAVAVGADGTVYVANGYQLYAINPNGTAKWQFAPNGGIGGSSPTLGPDGTIYIGAESCGYSGCFPYLYALNSNGSEKWVATISGSVLGAPAIGPNGTLYASVYTYPRGRLIAINSTGTQLWTFTTGDVNMSSPATGADGAIYVYAQDGHLYAVNPDGSPRWNFPTTSRPEGSNTDKSSPAIGADGTIYFGDLNGFVEAVNPDGTLKWSYFAGACSSILSSPAIGADGTVYIGDGDPSYSSCGGLLALGNAGAHALTSITPSAGGNVGQVAVTAAGSGFAPGATARLSGGGTAVITGTNVSVSFDGRTLTALFDLTGQSPGQRDFVVSNPGGSSMTIPGGFTIQAGGVPNVQFSLFGPAFLRAGEGRTYYASASNTGAIDGPGLAALVKIPSAIEVDTTLPRLVDADGTQTLLITCSEVALAPSQYCTAPFHLTVPDTPTYAHKDFSLAWSSFVTAVPSTPGDPTVQIQTTSFSGGSGSFQTTQHLSSATVAGDVSLTVSLAPSPALTVPQVTITDANGTTTISYQDDASQSGVNGTLKMADNIKGKYQQAQTTWQDLQAFQNHTATKKQLDFLCGRHLLSSSDCQTENNLNDGNLPLQIASNHIPEAAQPAWNASGGGALTGVMNGAVDKRLWVQMQEGQEEELAQYLSPFCKAEFNGCTDAHQLSESELTDLIDRVKAVAQNKGALQFQTITSGDPNDKSGPAGVGSQRWIPSTQALNYQVFFSNEPAASAPAQNVTITDQLDLTEVDLSTASLGPISFGRHVLTPPPGSTQYSAVVDLRPAQTLAVHINGQINRSTGLLTWTYTSIDPTTGQPPADPTAGFLPPDINPPNGEGDALFNAMPRAGLASGTPITNQATITFDANAPISTSTWLNTIDNSIPTSHVSPLPATETSAAFPVQWSGKDSFSGISDYSISVSVNGGPFGLWLDTSNTSETYRGQPGNTYAFYSLASSNVGNAEGAKTAAEATTTVLHVLYLPRVFR